MNCLERYYNNVIKFDLLNKFNYPRADDLPKFKSIILNFGCKASDMRKLSAAFLGLRLVTQKRGEIIVSKKSNIVLKIRKGDPVGCKVFLKKKLMYRFLTQLIVIIGNFRDKILLERKGTNSLTFSFNNPLVFNLLEKNYTTFNSIDRIHVTLITNTHNSNELFFLLNSFKFLKK